MHVYGDAVFFPLLRRETFLQEAYHFEPVDLDNPSSTLVPSGVVFNEMKGNYSSQSSIVAEYSIRSLFPDTPYGLESGGDPEEILNLTYEKLVDFHQRYYHPSNCKILLYGNIPPAEQLLFLENNFIGHFSAICPDSDICLQPRFKKPILVEKTYPSQGKTSPKNKTEITISWLLPPVTDPQVRTAFILLEEILAGHAGSPLRRSLVESGLGEDYTGAAGLETELKEMVFVTGLRGTNPEAASKLEELVLKTLSELVAKGIPRNTVMASLNHLELKSREISGGHLPWPLKLFQRALQGYLHGAPPYETLTTTAQLKKLKKTLKTEERYLEKLIETHLIQNPHRATLIVRPDPQSLEEFEKRLNQKSDKRLAGLNRQAILAELAALKEYQAKPNDPELERKMPSLRLSDLPTTVEKIALNEIELFSGLKLIHCPIFTNGLIYFDFAFDLEPLVKTSPEALPLLPLLGQALTGCGLPGFSYAVIQEKLSLLSGGFFANHEASLNLGNGNYRRLIIFRLKTLRSLVPGALELVASLFKQADFNDTRRIKDLVLELKNRIATALIPRGSWHAILRAGRYFSEAVAHQELMEGISQLNFLSKLSQELAVNPQQLSLQLEELRLKLLRLAPLTIAVTAMDKDLKSVEPHLRTFTQSIRLQSEIKEVAPHGDGGTREGASDKGPKTYPRTEAILGPTSVNFTAFCLKAAAFGSPEYAAELLLSNLMETGQLHELVRLKGGAYGASAFHFRQEGFMALASYRDPHLYETFEAFETVIGMAGLTRYSEADLEQALFGIIGKDEVPFRPNERGYVALRRHLFGISDELRQQNRTWLLSLKPADIKRAADRLFNTSFKASRAFITNQAGLEPIKQLDPWPELTETTLPL